MIYENIQMDYKTLRAQTERLQEHYHSGYEIIFITEGKSEFTINNSSYSFGEKSIVFINNLESHQMTPITPLYSRYMVIINSNFFDSIIKDPTILSIFKARPRNFKNGFQLKKEHENLVKEVFHDLSVIYKKQDVFWHIEFNALLSKLIVFLYREYKDYFPIKNIDKVEKRMLEIQLYIDENFQKDISLDSIATKFFVSKYYLAHSFREVTGFTIKQYILLKRISYAKDELFFTDHTITDIALDSGFNSQSNFIRIFKKKEGKTPLQFRKYYRGKVCT